MFDEGMGHEEREAVDVKTYTAVQGARIIGMNVHTFNKLVGYLRMVPVRWRAGKSKSLNRRTAYYTTEQVEAILAAHKAQVKLALDRMEMKRGETTER